MEQPIQRSDESSISKHKPIEREASFDQVRKLVKKEGIEAKNLVSWHVPLNETLLVDTGMGNETGVPEQDKNGTDISPKLKDGSSLKQEMNAQSAVAIRMKGGGKRPDYRSRQWSFLFETLRRTVDVIYDTCFCDQSILECKEAIMILENCTKDFYALIDYLNNQAVWEKSEKPIAMAWEVRKTAGSPNKHFPPQLPIQEGGRSGLALNLGNLLVSTVPAGDRGADESSAANGSAPAMASSNVAIVKAVATSRPRRRPRPTRLVPNVCSYQEVVLPPVKSVAAETTAPTAEAPSAIEQHDTLSCENADQKSVLPNQDDQLPADDGGVGQENAKAKNNDDDGWEVVCYSRGRRNSVDGKSDKAAAVQSQEGLERQAKAVTTSNHQQVSPNTFSTMAAKSGRTSVFPRNAQEIRQTKASLGKMVYNRQYLADQRQKELEDKLKLFDSRPSAVSGRRRAFAASGSSVSLPTLNSRIGINFSDPEAVKRSAQALKAALMKGGGRSRRFRSYQSMESVQSLESIKEEEGAGAHQDAMAAMLNTEDIGDKNGDVVQAEESDGCVEPNVPDNEAAESTKTDMPTDSTTEVAVEAVESDEARLQEAETSSDQGFHSDEANPKGDGEALTSLEQAPDPDSDEAWKHLTEEEESLAQEEESIQKEMEEERKSIDYEMSRHLDEDIFDDDDGTDREEKEEVEEDSQAMASTKLTPVNAKQMSWQELVARWEACPYSQSTLSWGDMVEMDLAEVRSPGQAVQVHEKLSSPSRQRNLTEDIKKREQRRLKADEKRQQMLETRLQRMRELSKRVEEVREARRRIVVKKKAMMEEKLAKAEENRHLHLMARVKKAHDEDEKVNEIAFINTLEAGNKRLDVMTRQQDVESRLQTIQEERQRKCEEKAAREAAAEERRKAAEERRQTKLLERAERTRKRQEQIDKQRCEQERERQQIAREKAREREERLAELKAAKQANTEELIQRIQQKQEESMRRHEENLEQIKQRASEMSTPRSAGAFAQGYDVSSTVLEMLRPPSCQPYVKQKLCTVCNILIPSDVHLLAHLKGKRHATALKDALPGKTVTKELTEQENQKCIVDASDEKVEALSPSPVASSDRAKMNRKRRQRLRQKLQAKAKEYNANPPKPQTPSWQSSPHLQKMTKAFRDIGRCLESCGLDKQWLSADVHTLERSVGELSRILSQQESAKEQEAFHGCKLQDQTLLLLSVLEKQDSAEVTRLPMRSIMNVCNLLKASVINNSVTSVDMMYSNRIGACIEALAFQLQCLNHDKLASKQCGQKAIPQECVVIQLMSLVSTLLDEFVKVLRNGNFKDYYGGEDGFRSRVSLVLSYMVACGIVDQFGAYCAAIVELPMEGVRYDVVLGGFHLITTMMKALVFSSGAVRAINEDATQLLEAIRCTEFCNLMPILYSVLMSPNTVSSSGDRQTPPKLSDSTIALVAAALDLINSTGAASRQLIQDILGQEGSSLEFRHVASFLISYGNRYECQTVLHRIIVSVGYFTVLNPENQALVHFGSQPSILQQLCVLPFAYFSDKKLTKILYPTLIACSYQNEANRYLLEQEMNCVLLSEFLKQRQATENDKGNGSDMEQPLYQLEWRFPKDEWKNAIDYFDTPSTA